MKTRLSESQLQKWKNKPITKLVLRPSKYFLSACDSDKVVSLDHIKLTDSLVGWGGAGGLEPGRKGAGSGISKVEGTRRKRVKFCNISLYFATEMGQREGNHSGKGRDAGIKCTGSGSFRPLPPPPPHAPPLISGFLAVSDTRHVYGLIFEHPRKSALLHIYRIHNYKYFKIPPLYLSWKRINGIDIWTEKNKNTGRVAAINYSRTNQLLSLIFQNFLTFSAITFHMILSGGSKQSLNCIN